MIVLSPLYLITNQLMILPIYWDQHIQIGTESTSNEVTPSISTSPLCVYASSPCKADPLLVMN